MRRAICLGIAGLLLSGCGASVPDRPSSANLTPVSTNSGAAPSSAVQPSSTVPPAGASSTNPTQTVTGTVSNKGLTCLVFDAGSAGRFALTGDVPSDVSKVAHGLGPGTTARPESVRIRVTGHYAPDLLSTCSLRVFVADKVVVLSPPSSTNAIG